MDKQIAEIFVYLNAMWRRRWLALSVAVTTCLAGWIAVAMIPDTYTSSARIYVDTETVLKPLLKDIAVDDNAQGEVRIMQQTLLSRPNLAQVARATDLDLTVSGPGEMEALLESLAQRTEISSNCQGAGPAMAARMAQCNLFAISFSDTDPRRAKTAVQSLLNIFMESRLGESRSQMDSARRFLDDQIRGYQNQLEEAEKRLANFKQGNLLTLPGPRSYERRLEELTEGHAALVGALEDAKTERSVLLEQLQSIPPVIASSSGAGFGSGPPSDYAIRIIQLQAQLDEMLTKYTPKHPDVSAVRRRIETLKAEEQRELQAMLAMSEPVDGQAPTEAQVPAYGAPNPAYSELRLIVAEKEADVARLEEQAARALAKLEELRGMALEVPVIEAELARLNRDYDVTKRQYEVLLERRESAKIARDREASGDKVQFRVIEPPEAPVRPSGPNRALLLSAVVPVGLGAGAALALVLAILSRTFIDPRRLGEDLGLPVLGSVSEISRPGDRRWQWANIALFVLAVAAMLAFYALLMLVENNIGLGRVAQAAVQTTSVGELVTLLKTALSRSFEMLSE
jgi:polysaccharide chain length determinant protein (PEP-CTERM system associated)